uniref:Concanavalin A-like lectin/glucanase superfamily protein n=1 Tax=Burkholderia phage vB_BgluM-SURPRISE13 TaxID=3159457 RepID=A0AAU7PF98_9VIRU
MQEGMLLKKKVSVAGSTFNPAMKSSAVALSNNNRTANLGNLGGCAFSTASRSSGKWYFEAVITQSESSFTPLIGLVSQSTTFNDPWTSAGELLWYGSGSQVIYGANSRFSYGSYATGDTVAFAVDLDARLIQFFRNNVALAQLNMNTYLAGVTTFWAGASSPHGSVGASIVTIPDTPQYFGSMPSGYGIW